MIPAKSRTPKDLIRLLARCEFRPFDREMMMAFAGCESPEPMFAKVQGDAGEDTNTLVILDGEQIEIHDYENSNDDPCEEPRIYQISDVTGG